MKPPRSITRALSRDPLARVKRPGPAQQSWRWDRTAPPGEEAHNELIERPETLDFEWDRA